MVIVDRRRGAFGTIVVAIVNWGGSGVRAIVVAIYRRSAAFGAVIVAMSADFSCSKRLSWARGVGMEGEIAHLAERGSPSMARPKAREDEACCPRNHCSRV